MQRYYNYVMTHIHAISTKGCKLMTNPRVYLYKQRLKEAKHNVSQRLSAWHLSKVSYNTRTKKILAFAVYFTLISTCTCTVSLISVNNLYCFTSEFSLHM